MDALWTESQKPKCLEDLDYHSEISNTLKKLAQNPDFPHLLFYGPNGAGKKTRVMAFLKEVYGPGVYIVNSEEKEFKINETSSTTVSCSVLSSKFHLDVAPSDAENHDKVIIQKLIKEAASSQQVNVKVHNFKVIVINEVDYLTKEAQASLRRTMEKYIERCRLILICESIAKVIHPIRSRCLLIRIPSPTDEQIGTILQQISKTQNIILPATICKQFVTHSKGNLRAAILQLQSQRLQAYPFTEQKTIPVQEWKTHIYTQVVDKIIQTQSAETLKAVRESFYQLVVNCIPGDRIMFEMMDNLLNKVNEKYHYDIIEATAVKENKMRQGQKQIYHLEALTAQYMVILKGSIQ